MNQALNISEREHNIAHILTSCVKISKSAGLITIPLEYVDRLRGMMLHGLAIRSQSTTNGVVRTDKTGVALLSRAAMATAFLSLKSNGTEFVAASAEMFTRDTDLERVGTYAQIIVPGDTNGLSESIDFKDSTITLDASKLSADTECIEFTWYYIPNMVCAPVSIGC